MNRLEPLRFRPTLREKVWGTLDLGPLQQTTDRRIGEAWCLNDGSAVAEGPLQGRTVASLVSGFGDRLMGPRWNPAVFDGPTGPGGLLGIPRNSFPIVGKILFGTGRLSIQVHPDNESAARLEGGTGKTELWYVAAAEPGAQLGLGTKEALNPEELAAAAADGSIEERLRWHPAEPGQSVLVPAGTVHSLRGGAVLCEIQQNSDITYRLFDYCQAGLDGRPRQLQLKRAVQVANTYSRPRPRIAEAGAAGPFRTMHLGRCPSFVAELLCWQSAFLYTPDPGRCQLLVFVEGFGTLQGIPFEAGDAFLIPAESGRFPVDGWKVRAVRAYVP